MAISKPLRPTTWAGAFLSLALTGCTVVSVTASAVGLAADAAIGTARIVGKGVGKAADAMLGDDEKEDNSGITIRYRESRDAPLQDQPPSAAPPASPAPQPRLQAGDTLNSVQ